MTPKQAISAVRAYVKAHKYKAMVGTPIPSGGGIWRIAVRRADGGVSIITVPHAEIAPFIKKRAARHRSVKKHTSARGYRPCGCRDCMETAIEPSAMCNACQSAGCDGGECQAEGAYGG